jgi:hypothetical protein
MLIEKSAGDFPVPCHYCGALIRRRRKTRTRATPQSASDHPAAAPIVLPYTTSNGLPRGMLARLLIDGAPQPAMASNNPLQSRRSPQPSVPTGCLQRAVFESRRRAVSALSWVGLLAALLAVGLWILKIQLA